MDKLIEPPLPQRPRHVHLLVWHSDDVAVLKRGVDSPEAGIESMGGTLFGHTRLSIIDVEGGHQPIKDSVSDLTIVVNGEIYNHKEVQ